MIRVTWGWLGQDLGLDLADTVTIVNGVEDDLLERPGEYERWVSAEAAAQALTPGEAEILLKSRIRLLALRGSVRDVIGAVADGGDPSTAAVDALNRASRAAPRWIEIDRETRRLHERSRSSAMANLLARYARSTLELVADPDTNSLRRCKAPSCGMFYRSSRRAQQWCSPQCGARARVARHYRAHTRQRRRAEAS
jgi:predicted RNA-binding Zn ribbon-like protein